MRESMGGDDSEGSTAGDRFLAARGQPHATAAPAPATARPRPHPPVSPSESSESYSDSSSLSPPSIVSLVSADRRAIERALNSDDDTSSFVALFT